VEKLSESDYSFTARVQKSYRVGIPKWIRQELNIKEGTLIKLTIIKKVK